MLIVTLLAGILSIYSEWIECLMESTFRRIIKLLKSIIYDLTLKTLKLEIENSITN